MSASASAATLDTTNGVAIIITLADSGTHEKYELINSMCHVPVQVC